MLHKGLANSLRDVDTLQGIVSGYASAFNNIDDDGDIIVRGAFAKTLAEQGPASRQPRIKFLYQHDATKLLGVPSVLREDEYGLYYEAKLASTPLAQDVLTLMAEGVLTEHSIGYEVVQAHYDRAQNARILAELKLYEFSTVTWGANAQTPVVSVKALTSVDGVAALASKAAKLDHLLHSGSLHSDGLCETLERELNALHTALAPHSAEPQSQPYSIQGVLASMSTLAERLAAKDAKGASQADKDAQTARSKKYGIGVKAGGNVTKPSAQSDVPDSQWGDPVNYRYPMADKAHADNAAARFGAESAREQYTAKEQDIIAKRIMARQKDFDEEPDWWPIEADDGKGATHMHHLVKGTGGDMEVHADGTHAAYTGTHTHSHKAMGSQGDDSMHEHEHSHDGDATHDHTHSAPKAAQPTATRRNGAKKAIDFNAALQIVGDDGSLQDDWGDAFQALNQAVLSAMGQAVYGYMPDGEGSFDASAAVKTILAQFGDALDDLVTRSLAAEFVPCLDDDGDAFLDPDGVNADEDDDYKSRKQLMATPHAPARLGKAGRSISNANRATLTTIADGIADHVNGILEHHGALVSLLKKTDPDAVRQDEDDTQGDSDSENGGQDVNKSRRTETTMRRTAAQAGTTHQGIMDTSAVFAELDALENRLIVAGRMK